MSTSLENSDSELKEPDTADLARDLLGTTVVGKQSDHCR